MPKLTNCGDSNISNSESEVEMEKSSPQSIKVVQRNIKPAGSGRKTAVKRVNNKACASACNDDLDAGDDDLSGTHVNQFLNKLGSELQHRLRAKKQRIESCFQEVKKTPKMLLDSRVNHTKERAKEIQKLKSEAGQLQQRLDNILQLQTINEEKMAKMMLSFQRSFDQMKTATTDAVGSLKNSLESYVTNIEKLEFKHEDETKLQLEQYQQELIVLQKKILVEGQQEETEKMKTSLQFLGN